MDSAEEIATREGGWEWERKGDAWQMTFKDGGQCNGGDFTKLP